MATTCTNCGCGPKKCGCQDAMLTTPAPCPTPVGCPEPAPCSEAFDAQCVIYTQDPILCGQTPVVDTNDSVSTALENIVDYFCTEVTTISINSLKKFVVTTPVSPVSTVFTILRTSLNACEIFDKPACNISSLPFPCDFTIDIYVFNTDSGFWRKLDGSNGVSITVDSSTENITITIPTLDPDDTQYRTVIIG